MLIIRRESEVIKRISLGAKTPIKHALENKVRDVPFIRLCISDRCISIFGKTYNYATGYSWDYVFQGHIDCNQSQYSNSQDKQSIAMIQYLPFSQQQIALLDNNKRGGSD